jgi:transcriptional regulator GlxA family with amidase domain
MLQSDDVGGAPQLDFEAWRTLLRSKCMGAVEAAHSIPRAADKPFTRIRGVIEHGLSDPDFGPAEVAAGARISLRCVRRPFAKHGTTYGEFIYSHRLHHAAHLLHHRAPSGTGQPLNEIASACGFHNHAHFARRFQKRFGYSPGAYTGRDSGDAAVRAGTAKSAFSARDVSFRTS